MLRVSGSATVLENEQGRPVQQGARSGFAHVQAASADYPVPCLTLEKNSHQMHHLIFLIVGPALTFLISVSLQASYLQKRDFAIVDSPSEDYEPLKTKCADGNFLRFSETGQVSCLSFLK